MYLFLLSIHSMVRWITLVCLLYAIYKSYRGWLTNKPFNQTDNVIRITTLALAHVQLIIGVILYFVSPIIQYFLNNFKDAVHIKGIRFFGMEHSLMMLIAIISITIGAVVAKRKTSDKSKFKTIAIWFSIALFLIFFAIPWPFLPFAPGRPYFRVF